MDRAQGAHQLSSTPYQRQDERQPPTYRHMKCTAPKWCDSLIVIMSEAVTSENHRPITSCVTKCVIYLKTYTISLISPMSLRTIFSNLALWCRQHWPVTSCKHRVLALWRQMLRFFLHAQNWAMLIFTGEQQPWIWYIDFLPMLSGYSYFVYVSKYWTSYWALYFKDCFHKWFWNFR